MFGQTRYPVATIASIENLIRLFPLALLANLTTSPIYCPVSFQHSVTGFLAVTLWPYRPLSNDPASCNDASSAHCNINTDRSHSLYSDYSVLFIKRIVHCFFFLPPSSYISDFLFVKQTIFSRQSLKG